MPAMADPTFCTSLGPMCFRTSAALSSPRVSSSTAARSVPLSFALSTIFAYPVLDHLRHAFGIFPDDAFRRIQILLVACAGTLQLGLLRDCRRKG